MNKLILLSVLLTACSSIIIKDELGCADIGSQGATCAHLFSPDTKDIPKPEWDDIRFGQICFSSDAVGDFKQEIESLCSECNCCDYPTLQSTEKKITIESLQEENSRVTKQNIELIRAIKSVVEKMDYFTKVIKRE